MKTIIMLVTLLPHLLFAAQERGGNQPFRVTQALIKHYLQDDVLKHSLSQYLRAIQRQYIENKKIAQFFNRRELLVDIWTKNNYVLKDHCESSTDIHSLASTQFSEIGGVICFNLDGLTKLYMKKGLTAEQILIELSAIAIHEHYHHFQINSPSDGNLQNEVDADKLSAFFMATAKLNQEPRLDWSKPNLGQGKRQIKCVYYPGGYDKDTLVFTINENNLVQSAQYLHSQSSELTTFWQTQEYIFEHTTNDVVIHLIASISPDKKSAVLTTVYKNSGQALSVEFFQCD